MSVNKAIIIGNLGKDPVVRVMTNGTQATSISIATSEKWKDKQSGETEEKTEWHNIALFGKLAEIAGEYLKKGSSVYIEGRIQYKKWTDKEGVERNSTEIVASQLKMLGKAGDNKSSSKPAGNEFQDSNLDEVAF